MDQTLRKYESREFGYKAALLSAGQLSRRAGSHRLPATSESSIQPNEIRHDGGTTGGECVFGVESGSFRIENIEEGGETSVFVLGPGNSGSLRTCRS